MHTFISIPRPGGMMVLRTHPLSFEQRHEIAESIARFRGQWNLPIIADAEELQVLPLAPQPMRHTHPLTIHRRRQSRRLGRTREVTILARHLSGKLQSLMDAAVAVGPRAFQPAVVGAPNSRSAAVAVTGTAGFQPAAVPLSGAQPHRARERVQTARRPEGEDAVPAAAVEVRDAH